MVVALRVGASCWEGMVAGTVGRSRGSGGIHDRGKGVGQQSRIRDVMCGGACSPAWVGYLGAWLIYRGPFRANQPSRRLHRRCPAKPPNINTKPHKLARSLTHRRSVFKLAVHIDTTIRAHPSRKASTTHQNTQHDDRTVAELRLLASQAEHQGPIFVNHTRPKASANTQRAQQQRHRELIWHHQHT